MNSRLIPAVPVPHGRVQSGARLRVLVADPHVLSRRGWKSVFEETGDLCVCWECGSCAETLRGLESAQPEVLIVDLEMGEDDGLEFVRRVRRLYPGVAVLVHTGLCEAEFGPRVLGAGAAGFLPKTAGVDLVLQAVRKLGHGGRFVTESLAETLASRLDGAGAPHEALSRREYQVFCLIAGGKQVSEVAKELSLSVKTISTFRSRILGKLGMKTNGDLMRYAFKRGIVK